MSDLDANILPSDTYKSATNARLVSREDNSFILKNAKGNSLYDTLTISEKKVTFSETGILSNTAIDNLDGPSAYGIRMYINGDGGFIQKVFNFYSGDTVGSWGGVLEGMTVSISSGADILVLIYLCVQKALADETVSEAMNMSFNNNYDGSAYINYSDKTSEAMTLTFKAYVRYTDGGAEVFSDYPISTGNGYSEVSYIGVNYEIVALANFSDYMVAITTSSAGNGGDAIFKLTSNNDGSLLNREMIIQTDLGLVSKSSIRLEVSEENEHFHRIYWTDGVNPLRTVNLNESDSYYSNLVASDLNVFKATKMVSPTVTRITSGGNISCGSHSYCYRLVTTDGKTSRVSNITNPVQILKTSPLTSYHLSLGGSLETNSSNAVHLTIDNIDPSYNTIQIIDITYTSAEGAITSNIISESIINSTSFDYTHNGSEVLVSIPIGELLRSHTSWDVCADLAIKDNRLFAANLTNNSDSIDLDFRVKSYRYLGAYNTGTAATYNDSENPEMHEDTMYKDGGYGWINAVDTVKVPGAETVGFDAADDGVRVTFATKTFDLSQVKYFDNSGTGDDTDSARIASSVYGQVPHHGYLETTQAGGYNNYKNPLFTKDFTGYQRGEVYRFGILFYDKSGNPGFVSPIGDIRMPDGTMDYVSNDSAGNRVTQNSDGVTTFKHAGNLPTRSYSWAFDDASPILNKVGGGSGLAVHDVVTGTGIPPHTTIVSIAGDNDSITVSRNSTSEGTATTLTFDTTTSDVSGFALYPQFNVKLSSDTRSKISGYSIVRVDRKQKDKSVLGSGVLNQTIIHSNDSANESLRHKNGNHYGDIYTGYHAHECLSDSDFTFDTPEVTLGSLQYDRKDEDKIKVVGRLDAGAQELNDESFPYDNTITDMDNFTHLKQKIQSTSTYTGNILSGRFNPNTNDQLYTYQSSQKVIYSQFKSGVVDCNSASESQKINEVEYGTIVSPGGGVDKGRMGHDDHGTGRDNQNYSNRGRFKNLQGSLYSEGFYHFPDSYTTKKYNSASSYNSTLFGVTTLFVTLGKEVTDKIRHSHFGIGTGNAYTYSPFVLNRTTDGLSYQQACYASKLYVQLKRDVRFTQYGGSLLSNYESNQYISTGHVNFSPLASNSDSVFGGDIYINMYALKKHIIGSTTYSTIKPYPSTAIIFPVESSVNLDLRDGVFFGSTDSTEPTVEDNFLINSTYSSRNTSKTFLQKPGSFKNVNSYSNLVAASNLKLAGNLFDAFTTWDANEIHELDNNKGAIYNLFSLRNELFAIQQSGVSKLSINPRVVVDSADAAAVTIVTGTGQVIQRSDYIETSYGSQHFNNMLVTNTSAYWYDSNMSSLCKLVVGKGIAVQDLGITTQNSNIFNALKDTLISDKPLDFTVGGICLYHNKVYDEVGICITTADNDAVHVVYSELNDVMITRKEDIISMATNIPGELITIGRNSSDEVQYSSNLWRENSGSDYLTFYGTSNTNSLDVTFVCNENVYSSKKFDKLVMYLSGNENVEKFTTFTFTDSVSNTPFSTTGTGAKMSNGKHIIPITSTDGTSKATGQHLIIQAKSTSPDSIELFGALIHNRPTK